MYTRDSEARDGVGLGTAVRGPSRVRRSAAFEPGHTISTEGSVEGAHAVEFSKTVAPLREGDSFPAGARSQDPAPSGQTSIATAGGCDVESFPASAGQRIGRPERGPAPRLIRLPRDTAYDQ